MPNKTFESLLEEMLSLHNKKAQDYAQEGNPYSNFERASILSSWFSNPLDSVFAALIGIKLARLAELLSSGKVPNNEPVDDTLRDLTVYCALWTCNVRDRTPKETEWITTYKGVPHVHSWRGGAFSYCLTCGINADEVNSAQQSQTPVTTKDK